MSTVRIEHDGPVTIVTIDRPDVRNAVDRATAEALADAFRAFEDDGARDVAILTGAGGAFCAGADLKAISSGGGNRAAPDGDGPMGPTRMLLDKPVIAAVEGHAVAGGLELALWCDLRVAARDAVFGVYCRRWGVPLIDGGTVRLPRLIGHSRALDMILTTGHGAREPDRRAGRGPRGCARSGSRARRSPAVVPPQRSTLELRAMGAVARRRVVERVRARRGDDRVG
jgi:enoyl-CoA hydratase